MNLAAPWIDVAGLRLTGDTRVRHAPPDRWFGARISRGACLGWYFMPSITRAQAVMAAAAGFQSRLRLHLRVAAARGPRAPCTAVQSLAPLLGHPPTRSVRGAAPPVGDSPWPARQSWRQRHARTRTSQSERHVFSVVMALLAPCSRFPLAGARGMHFAVARLGGVLFTILTLEGVVWCLLAWGDLAFLFSGAG